MPGYLRIATEEAYAPPELFERYRKLLASGKVDDPGFESLMGFYLTNPSPRIKDVRDRLEDVGARRLHDMDQSGIQRQIL
jgi:2,3-dihydroxybenzoate decarboxylase